MANFSQLTIQRAGKKIVPRLLCRLTGCLTGMDAHRKQSKMAREIDMAAIASAELAGNGLRNQILGVLV